MYERASGRRVIAAASALAAGMGLAALCIVCTGTEGALAAPPPSVPRAGLLDAAAGITVVKTAPATVYQALEAGPTFVPYSLTIENPGGYTILPGAVVTDGLPAGTALVGGTTGPGWSGAFPGGGQEVIYTLLQTQTAATIDVGGYLAALNVPVRDRSVIVNDRYCFSGTVNSGLQTFCENTPVTTVVRAPDFSLVENHSVPVCAGGQVTYTLTVTNPGGVRTALPYTITGQITPVLSVVSVSDGGTWSPPVITWSAADVLYANGVNHITRTFAVTIPASTPHGTLLTNTYAVTSAEVLPNVAFWQSAGVTVTRPTAAFTSTAPACQNSLVAFYNNSLGATSYQWNFGDGSPVSTDVNPVHAYTNYDTYTVILTATGACGTSVVTSAVTINPMPVPVLQIVPDPTQMGVTTYFTDSGLLGTSWNWSFGDGGVASTLWPTTSHVYTGLAGPYTVVLTSTGAAGCYSVTSRTLLVNPGAPYTVSLSAWPLYPTVGSSAAVTATATDQWGNPLLDGTPITFTATPPPAVIAPGVGSMTGGAAHATVTSTLAGPVTLQGTAPNGVHGTTVVTFTPGAPATLTLAVAPLTLPAGSSAAITATVVDAYNNPIPNRVITFTVAGALGGGALVPPTAATDALGRAYATLNSTLPGLKTITATATAAVWDSKVVTFTAAAPYTVTLIADPATLTVGSTSALTATVTDRYANVIVGEVISFTTADDLGLGGISPGADATDAGGQAHAALMSTSAGSKTIRATASNLVSGTVVVNFQAGAPASILVSALPATQTVGLSSQLLAQVRDQYLNVVSGAVITFTTPDGLGLGGIAPITDTTSGFGWASSRITSTLPGPKTVVATAANLVSGTTVITFTAGAPSSLTLAALPTTLQVGNAAALTATLTDQYANPLAGCTVAFTTTAPLGLGALTPLSSATGSAGQAASAISATLPGVKTITATHGGLTATAQVTFTVGDPFTVTLVAFPTTLQVGNTAALTATVTDRYANPIPGAIVGFAGSIGSVWPFAGSTDGNGQATSSISSTLAGQAVVTATESALGLYGTTVITFTPGPPASLILAANPLTLAVGGTSFLTATLRDQYTNPLAGYVISFTTGASLGGGSLAPATDTTDASGQAHAAISSTLSGAKPVVATAPTGLTDTVTVTFNPGMPAAVALVAAPPMPVVGTSAALTATVVDGYGNGVPGQVVTFTHGGALGLGTLAPVTATTGATGWAASAVTSTLPGVVPLTATIAGGIQGTASVTFTAGAPYSLTLVAVPSSLSVGGTAALTATLTDLFGNRLAGYTISFTTTDPLGSGGLVPLSGVTGATGEATSALSSTLTGVKTITATGGGLTATAQVTFDPGAPTTLALAAWPTTLAVGGTANLTATLTDPFGNPIPGRFIAFTSSGPAPSPPGGSTNAGGQVNSGISSLVAGQFVVTATDFLSPTVYGTAVVTFTGGVPVSLTLVADPATLAVGGTSLLTATLRDAYGNPSPGYTVNFTTTDPLGSGGLWPLSGVTGATGQATSALSSTLTGVKTVTATGAGLTATAQVTFGVGTLATIVVTPNPVTVTVGATQPFTATGYDGFGNPVPVAPTWATNGGTVNPGPGATTVFTAQTTPATGRLVTATQGTVSGMAIVNIVAGSATSIELAPDAATIAAGQTQAYTVTARDAYSNTWDVTASSAFAITPGAAGSWAANAYTGQIAGVWTVTATYLSLADTAILTVTHAPTATSAALSPNPHTVGAGGTVVYTLVATDTYGNGWDATASGVYTITPAAGGSWAANVYTSQYTGTWTVTATVPSATATAVLTVTMLPAASFIRAPAGAVCVSATVQFTDTSSGGPTAWLWSFGDGVTTTIQHPAHVYTAVNTYTVTLGVSNLYGSSAATDTVEVIAGPVVSITRTPSGAVCVGTGVAFTATNAGGPATYLWNFGDAVTATGQSAVHAYGAPGTYTVWLTATNGCGTSVVSATVTVNTGPTAGFVRDPAGDVILGVTVQFTDTSTGGPTAWLWDFGDGVTSTVQHPTHAYTATGTYSVTLTVSNGCGASSVTGTVNVITGCVLPAITGLASNSPITQGQTMVLTATVAGSVPITFTWNYGDGSPPVTGVGLVTTTHVYTASGVLTVTLAVTNACGSASASLPVTVTAGVGGEPDHMLLVAVPSSLPVSHTATLTATLYDVFDVPLAGQVITFTTPDPLGGGSLIPVTATTSALGQATAIISSTVTGVKRVTALAHNLVSASTNVTFVSGYTLYLPLVLRDYAPPVGSITLVAHPLVSPVGSAVVLTATVTNPGGSPAAGVAVQFVLTSTLTGVVFVPPGAATDANGQVTATVTSASVGAVQVTAQAAGYGADSVYIYFRPFGAACAPYVLAAIPTGPKPREVTLDTLGRRAFVAHENGLTVISYTAGLSPTFTVITDVRSFTGGYGVAYDFVRNRIWVSQWSSDRVVVLDGATYATLASLPTGAWPHSVEFNPANGRVYVANLVASTVGVYNATGLALERTLTDFAGPTHLAANPLTNKIYVVNHDLYGNITVIDGNTHATRRINTDLFDAYDVAIDTTRNLVYATSLGEGRISVINGATDTVSDCLHIRPVAPPLRHLWLYTIGVNPDAGPGGTPHLWAVNYSAEDAAGRLLLLSLRGDGWLAQGSHPVRLDIAPYPHNGLAVDTATDRIWLTGLESDLVTVVQDGPTTCPTWDEVYVDLCSQYFQP